MHIYSDAGVYRLYKNLTSANKKAECWKERAKYWKERAESAGDKTDKMSASFSKDKFQQQDDEDTTYLDLKMEMNLDEGISLQDIQKVFPKSLISKCLKNLQVDDSTVQADPPCCSSSSFSAYRTPSETNSFPQRDTYIHPNTTVATGGSQNTSKVQPCRPSWRPYTKQG